MFPIKKAEAAPRQVIEYPIPPKMPRRMRWVRRILILTGLSSFLSFITAFEVVEAMIAELAKVEGAARHAVRHMPANPDNPALVGADVLTVAKNFSLALSGVLSVLFLYFPVRYFQLFRRLPKAHPDTYRAVRDLAIIQIVVELIKVTTFEATNAETAVIKFPPAASPALFLSIIVLWLITRQKSKEFFFRPVLVPVVADL